MRRFRFVLLALALVGGSVFVAPSADAHTFTCGGQGNFYTGTRMTLTGPAVRTTFTVTFGPLGCPEMNGTMTGNCSFSSGSGGSNNHYFWFSGWGGTLYFDGDVTGMLTLFREGDGIPCNGGQHTFHFTGVLHYSH